jgi:hypothetical protein
VTNAPPLSLAPLDDLPELPPAPAIFEANLAALSVSQPDFAEKLRACADHGGLTLRAGLDGAAFVSQSDGQSRATGTAAPQTRAIGLFEAHHVTAGNYLWPAMGHAVEFDVLLRYLPGTTATFVPVDDLRRLRAELHVVDLSAAVRAGRLYFLPDDMEAALTSLLARKPGLQPPSTVLRLPWTPADATDRVIGVATRCHAAVMQERNRQIEAALNEAAAQDADPRAVAVVCRTPDAVAQAVAAELARGAAEDGFQSVVATALRPDEQHLFGLIRRLQAQRPGRIVILDESNVPFPQSRGTVVVPALTAARNGEGTEAPTERHPAVVIAPAAHGAADGPLPPTDDAIAGEILLIGAAELPASLTGIGLDQPTHAQIWEAAATLRITSLDEPWPTAAHLFDRAAKAAGLAPPTATRTLLEPAFRRWMLPTRLQAHIEHIARQASWALRDATLLSPAQWMPPRSDRGLATVVGPLAWRGHEVMTAAALGWRIVVCAPVRDEVAAAAVPGELPIETPRSGRDLLKLMNAKAAERRTHIERTMSCVRGRHLLLHRWRMLATWPQSAAAEGSK